MLALRTALSLAYEHVAAPYLEEDDESDGDDPNPATAAAELNAWFARCGGSGAAEVRASADNRCGLFATAPLGAGDAYVRAPRRPLPTASSLASAALAGRGATAAAGRDAEGIVALTVCARLALATAGGASPMLRTCGRCRSAKAHWPAAGRGRVPAGTARSTRSGRAARRGPFRGRRARATSACRGAGGGPTGVG